MTAETNVFITNLIEVREPGQRNTTIFEVEAIL